MSEEFRPNYRPLGKNQLINPREEVLSKLKLFPGPQRRGTGGTLN